MLWHNKIYKNCKYIQYGDGGKENLKKGKCRAQSVKKEIHRIQRYIQHKKRQNVNDHAIPKIQRKRKVQER